MIRLEMFVTVKHTLGVSMQYIKCKIMWVIMSDYEDLKALDESIISKKRKISQHILELQAQLEILDELEAEVLSRIDHFTNQLN